MLTFEPDLPFLVEFVDPKPKRRFQGFINRLRSSDVANHLGDFVTPILLLDHVEDRLPALVGEQTTFRDKVDRWHIACDRRVTQLIVGNDIPSLP